MSSTSSSSVTSYLTRFDQLIEIQAQSYGLLTRLLEQEPVEEDCGDALLLTTMDRLDTKFDICVRQANGILGLMIELVARLGSVTSSSTSTSSLSSSRESLA